MLLWSLFFLLAQQARKAIAGCCHTTASGVVHALCVLLQRLKTTNSNIFFHKTTGLTVLKFHMHHDLTQSLRIVKFGLIEYPRWPRLLKLAKTTNQLLLQNQRNVYLRSGKIFVVFCLHYLAEIWHGASVKCRYSEL